MVSPANISQTHPEPPPTPVNPQFLPHTAILSSHHFSDEHTDHGWCHVISNAMIVVAALLYGGGDFGKSICIAVGMAFDTDCNGATVGSILGMANGISTIPAYWMAPINDTLMTTITWVSQA